MSKSSKRTEKQPQAHQLIQSMEDLETVISIDPKRQMLQAVSPVPSGVNSPLSLLLHLEFFLILCLHLLVLFQLKRH